jgi:oxygen-independent coproporphyrinogen III oxidase
MDLLRRFDRPVPRYTSYPPAPEWESLTEEVYQFHLAQSKTTQQPLSVYIHIPFCKTMCLYCACSVVLNRRPHYEQRYIDYLGREIQLVAPYLGHRPVRQLHLGGGTPTQLSIPQLEQLMETLKRHLHLDLEGEISIEVDPRTVADDGGKKLRLLRTLGFNRVSFGVQDTQEEVQRAVRRYQSLEVTAQTYHLARELEFAGVNIDLIYGLPLQTPDSFCRTIRDILLLKPDRIALYSYAHVPWLKDHQKAIRAESLPSTEQKFTIYLHAREAFLNAGYVAIGMDHFALAHDPLASALAHRQLHRNFQGYSLKLAEDLLGLGMTATGLMGCCYVQNVKSLLEYYGALDRGRLPTFRGRVLSNDDVTRRWTIQRLMCDFSVEFAAFESQFGVPFWSYFDREKDAIRALAADGLVEASELRLSATSTGSLFIRNIASTFDAYFQRNQSEQRFSRGI